MIWAWLSRLFFLFVFLMSSLIPTTCVALPCGSIGLWEMERACEDVRRFAELLLL